jgi:hypothetical protein
MPIRLNLLAEAQAAEDLRRRDPLKRTIWVCGLLVALALAWSGLEQVKVLWAQRELHLIEKQISTRTNEYQQVLESVKKARDVDGKLSALRQLATCRFLNGTLLNALQQSTVEDVQLTHLKVEQTFVLNEEVKAKTNASGRRLLGKPASVTEKIVLTIEGRDSSPNPGDQVIPFKGTVASNAYFQKVLGKTNEVQLDQFLPPQYPPDGRAYRPFTLKCRYPDQTR